MTDEEIIAAFHAIWDNYPERAMLTQKSREIIAVNPQWAKRGVKPGTLCSEIGQPKNHKGCQCDRAADTAAPVGVAFEGPHGKGFKFWVPVEGRSDWIVHFAVGSSVSYPTAAKLAAEG